MTEARTKRRFLQLVFTVDCFKKPLLIRVVKLVFSDSDWLIPKNLKASFLRLLSFP